jgi:hypothetical protein
MVRNERKLHDDTNEVHVVVVRVDGRTSVTPFSYNDTII